MNFKLLILIFVFICTKASAGIKIPSYKSEELFLIVSDTGTYSSLLIKYSDKISENFLIQKNYGFYFSPQYNFIDYYHNGERISLFKFNFDFLNIKDNVIKFIQPELFIKVMYVINGRYHLRITDAMRTVEQQSKYLRRGWSSRESSPHLFGLAFDLNDYTREEREDMRIRSQVLGLKFLEHGRHRHIHLEDSARWETNLNFYNDNCCNIINEKLEYKNSVLFQSFKIQPFESYNNFIPVNLDINETGLVKIVYKSNYKIYFEIICGVFEPGKRKIFLNKYLSHLKPGFYTVYLNDKIIDVF